MGDACPPTAPDELYLGEIYIYIYPDVQALQAVRGARVELPRAHADPLHGRERERGVSRFFFLSFFLSSEKRVFKKPPRRSRVARVCVRVGRDARDLLPTRLARRLALLHLGARPARTGCDSSNLQIFKSSNLQIFKSSHFHIFTFSKEKIQISKFENAGWPISDCTAEGLKSVLAMRQQLAPACGNHISSRAQVGAGVVVARAPDSSAVLAARVCAKRILPTQPRAAAADLVRAPRAGGQRHPLAAERRRRLRECRRRLWKIKEPVA